MSLTKKLSFLCFGLLLMALDAQANEAQADETLATKNLANQNLDIQYFAGMSGVISPFLEYHPVLAVTPSEALTIAHYRVMKDADGRLLEIAWFNKDEAANNSYFGCHKVIYSYPAEGQYSRKYFDLQGHPTQMWRHYYQGGEIHEERYQVRDDQRSVKLFNEKGEAIESAIGAHHFTARPLDQRRYLQTQQNLRGKAVPFRNVMPFMTAIVSVDGDGYLDKVLNVDRQTLKAKFHEKAGFAAIKVNFDENGLELGWEYQDETGSLVNLPESDPDEPGAALTVWFKQWHNQRLNQWAQVFARYYDNTGAVIADKRGVYLTRYRKDEHNRIAEIAWYDANNDLIFVEEEGFARKEFHYEYVNKGEDVNTTKPVEKRFDANNQLIAQ